MADPPPENDPSPHGGRHGRDGASERHRPSAGERRPSPKDPPRPSVTDPAVRARHAEYWRRNVRYVGVLLSIWFVVSYGFGILLAEPLNRFTLPGTHYPLGFWFAQQGSIYVFVALIFAYVWLMNRLDREFDVDEGATPVRGAGGADGSRVSEGGLEADGGRRPEAGSGEGRRPEAGP